MSMVFMFVDELQDIPRGLWALLLSHLPAELFSCSDDEFRVPVLASDLCLNLSSTPSKLIDPGGLSPQGSVHG